MRECCAGFGQGRCGAWMMKDGAPLPWQANGATGPDGTTSTDTSTSGDRAAPDQSRAYLMMQQSTGPSRSCASAEVVRHCLLSGNPYTRGSRLRPASAARRPSTPLPTRVAGPTAPWPRPPALSESARPPCDRPPIRPCANRPLQSYAVAGTNFTPSTALQGSERILLVCSGEQRFAPQADVDHTRRYRSR